MTNQNQSMSSGKITPILGKKIPRIGLSALKSTGKQGDTESLISINDGNFLITDADKFQYCPFFEDFGINVLPGKGKFLNDDEKLNLQNAKMYLEVYDDKKFFLLGIILHIYENGGTTLSTAECAFDGNDSVEEIVDSLIPAEAYDHDFAIITPVQIPFYSNETKWTLSGVLDISDIYNKVINDWFSSPQPRDQKYELGMLVYSPVATNTVYWRSICNVRGRIVPFRRALI